MSIKLSILTDIGLNEKEARCYIATLDLERATLSDIAKRSGIKRSTTYSIIDTLMRKGIIIKNVHKTHAQYTAQPIEDFLFSAKARLKTLEKNLTLFEKQNTTTQKHTLSLDGCREWINQEVKTSTRIRIFSGTDDDSLQFTQNILRAHEKMNTQLLSETTTHSRKALKLWPQFPHTEVRLISPQCSSHQIVLCLMDSRALFIDLGSKNGEVVTSIKLCTLLSIFFTASWENPTTSKLPN